MAHRRFALILAASLALALVPVPVGAAESAAHSDPSAAAATADALRPFSMNLLRRNDFVAQTNNVQCVGASMQMMINMTRAGADRTAKTQLRLQTLARRWSGPGPSGRTRQGASVRGWAAGLTIMDAGPYKLVGAKSIQGVLKTAARAMRATGKPVGLLMWRGRHAWVMTGFRATADPARTSKFTVTGVYVADPLYPHGSSVWGASPRPGQLLTVSQLSRQFLPRRNNRQSSIWAGTNRWSQLGGKYVVVLPYEPRPLGAWAERYR
jgi:hypothetical protein